MFSPHLSQVSPLRTVLLVDLSSAIAAHTWFKKYEPRDMTSCLVRLAVFAIAPIVTVVMNLDSPWINVPLHLALFVCFVLSSVLLYRLSPFHSLARFPGPIICRTSNIWLAKVSHGGKLHLYFAELHKKYGPIVRVGPNDLSIVEAKLLPDILGQQGMPKGPVWEAKSFVSHSSIQTNQSLMRVRDLNIHAQLRKPWNKAFGPGPMQDYEESLITEGTELIELLKEVCQNSKDGFGHVDMVDYIGRWSFDFMGNIAFGESFGLKRNGDKEGVIHSVKASNELPSVAQMIPWASHFIRSIPFLNKDLGAFAKFAVQQAQKRISRTTGKRDLFYHLAANMNTDDDKPSAPVILSNVGATIVAGSDTTGTVLSVIMFHLVRYPDYLRRLREELDSTFPPSELVEIRLDKLNNLVLLNAIINEVLRLLPPVLTDLQRAPARNSGGKLIGDIFIREDTAVFVPPYVMHRDPRYFYPKPDEFWPERWFIQRADMVLDRSAYIPFSYGPANCVGKSLALSELRYITAMLVYNFELWFEDGYDPRQWERDLLDRMLLVTGKLPVKIKQRIL